MLSLKEYISNNFSPKRPSTCIVALKKNKDGMLDELKLATSFLDGNYPEISVNQRLHHYLNEIQYVKVCKYCDNPLQIKPFNARITGEFYNGTCESKECRSKFNGDQSKKGCLEKHGVENISQTPEWREKVKKTNLERRGVEWITQSENFKKKSKETCLLKYDAEYYTQSSSYLDKSQLTCLNKYGETHPTKNSEIFNKIKNTNIERYGKPCCLSNGEIRKKAKATCLLKYGVEFPIQNTEVFESITKKCMKFKEFEFPSGRKDYVQGYETFALTELLEVGVFEEDIITNRKDIEKYIGKIFYEDKLGNVRRYYPDIYIVSLNKIIEVKSSYTYKKGYESNKLKKDAILSNGMVFEFWIVYPKDNRIEKINK
jgi:hypothetical protein